MSIYPGYDGPYPDIAICVSDGSFEKQLLESVTAIEQVVCEPELGQESIFHVYCQADGTTTYCRKEFFVGGAVQTMDALVKSSHGKLNVNSIKVECAYDGQVCQEPPWIDALVKFRIIHEATHIHQFLMEETVLLE